MLNAINKNNSGTDVKNAIIAFAAWEKIKTIVIQYTDYNGINPHYDEWKDK